MKTKDNMHLLNRKKIRENCIIIPRVFPWHAFDGRDLPRAGLAYMARPRCRLINTNDHLVTPKSVIYQDK